MRTTGKEIARGLRAAYIAMRKQAQRLLTPYDITADQYVVLALLALQDGAKQSELATRASSDPNTIRAILVLLERKGLVARRNHESDLRAHKVFLTAGGRCLYAKLAEALLPLQDALLAPFNEKDAKRLATCLQQIGSILNHWDGGTNGVRSSSVAKRPSPKPSRSRS